MLRTKAWYVMKNIAQSISPGLSASRRHFTSLREESSAKTITFTDEVSDMVVKMRSANVYRACITFDTNAETGAKTAKVSHPMFKEVADHILTNPFFMDHEAVFLAIGKSTGLLHAGFIHSTSRGPAAGGVKRFAYDSVGALIQDGLQQSSSSSIKAAHAGLWVGGGKVLIPLLPTEQSSVFINPTTTDGDVLPVDTTVSSSSTPSTSKLSRTTVFEEHAAFINSLQGCMLSARDMGVTVEDMDIVSKNTRFCTWRGIDAAAQGQLVGEGVAAAMEAALAWAGDSGSVNVGDVGVGGVGVAGVGVGGPVGRGNPRVATVDSATADIGGGSLVGKRVGVMGAGHVAKGVIKAVLDRGAAEVLVTDTNAQRIMEINQLYGGVRVSARVVPAWDMSILAADVDVLSPCAFSGALNPLTVPSVRARFVVGGANHTLLDPVRDGRALAQRGVICVPDHISNRLALVSSTVGQAGILMNDPEIRKHLDPEFPLSIPATVTRVLSLAKEEQCTPAEASVKLTTDILKQPHPIWPRRARLVMEDLIVHGWANNGGN